jgi:hypothetical protein
VAISIQRLTVGIHIAEPVQGFLEFADVAGCLLRRLGMAFLSDSGTQSRRAMVRIWRGGHAKAFQALFEPTGTPVRRGPVGCRVTGRSNELCDVTAGNGCSL